MSQHFHMTYSELLHHCEGITVSVSQEANAVEQATREQANCKLWNQFRSGRITASRMREACHNKPATPSRSLVSAICHPGSIKFKTTATEWGCSHEKIARQAYCETVGVSHTNFKIFDVGFVINPISTLRSLTRWRLFV